MSRYWVREHNFAVCRINASIVQGSGIGPMSYVLTRKIKKPVLPENKFSKYADDGDLVVPSVNSSQISVEVDNIQQQASHSNLVIDPNMTKGIIIYRQGNWIIPPCMPSIQKVTSMKILRVEFDETLSFKKHVDNSYNKAACSLSALKIPEIKGYRSGATMGYNKADPISLRRCGGVSWIILQGLDINQSYLDWKNYNTYLTNTKTL